MPFKSMAQEKYFHWLASKGKLPKSIDLHEWDEATKGHELPEHAEDETEHFAEGGDVLTAEARKHIAEKNFALPGGRYPIEDETHARNALARVSEFGSPYEKKEVREKVHAKYPEMEFEGGEIKEHLPDKESSLKRLLLKHKMRSLAGRFK